jgi:hypothetical protein
MGFPEVHRSALQVPEPPSANQLIDPSANPFDPLIFPRSVSEALYRQLAWALAST